MSWLTARTGNFLSQEVATSNKFYFEHKSRRTTWPPVGQFVSWTIFSSRYIGSFVCFMLLTPNLFRRTPKDRTIKKVLVIELFEMGASLMAYPSLQYIKGAPRTPRSMSCVSIT